MPTVPPPGYRADTAGNLIPERGPWYVYDLPTVRIPVPMVGDPPGTCTIFQWPPPGGERPIEEVMDDLWARGWPFPRPQSTDRPEALRPEDV